MKQRLLLPLIAIFSYSNLFASEYRSGYSGQQNREIKSLSAEDVQQIKAGKGWGLAKAGELNGYPGPSHVLDMAEKLDLTADQLSVMDNLFKSMQLKAIAAGERYLKAERQIDQAFVDKNIDSVSLKKMIDSSAEALAELRYVHLNTHLSTIQLLTRHQTATYNRLRGYGNTHHQH